jgi:hypothetical protein
LARLRCTRVSGPHPIMRKPLPVLLTVLVLNGLLAVAIGLRYRQVRLAWELHSVATRSFEALQPERTP